MLTMMREYATEQLDKSGYLPTTAQRHAEYYRDLSQQLGTIVRGPDQAECVDRLSHGTGTGDIDNVLAAMRWYLTQDQPGSVADILWSLWLLGWISGRLVECRGRARRGLSGDSELTQLAPGSTAHGRWACSTCGSGTTTGRCQRFNRVWSSLASLGDDDVLATSLLGLSLVSSFVGDTDVAQSRRRRKRSPSSGHGADRWGQATGFSLLTWFIVGDDSFDANTEVFEEALVVADQLADEVNRAMIETNVAEQQLHLERARRGSRPARPQFAAIRRSESALPTSYAIDCAARLAAGYGTPGIAARCSAPPTACGRSSAYPAKDPTRARRGQLEEQIRPSTSTKLSYDEALADGEAMCFEKAIEFATLAVRREPHPPRRPDGHQPFVGGQPHPSACRLKSTSSPRLSSW